MSTRFGDLRPGDTFYFAVDGRAVESPCYLVVEHGLAYRWFTNAGIEWDCPRRIGPDLEVIHVAHFSLTIGRDLGQIPPALPPDARAINDLPEEEERRDVPHPSAE